MIFICSKDISMEKVTESVIQSLGLYKKIAHGVFKNLTKGHLVIRENGNTYHFGDRGVESIELKVSDSNFYRKIVLKGEVGLGESFMDGDWFTDDLTTFLKLIIDNQEGLGDSSAVSEMSKRASLNFLSFVDDISHRLNHNSKDNSQKNISYHYDLSNDFYKLWLDETMTYSSAIFKDFDEDLRKAQLRKYDNLLNALELKDGQDLLEIGSGWGGLSKRAAEHFNVNVHTVTISKEQYNYAKDLFERNSLDNINLMFKDYRDIEGKFDNIVSCEMIEAVGDSYFDSYFKKVSESLKPGGRFSMQGILMPSSRYQTYTKSSDWIRKYIFPGGHLPSIERLINVAKKYNLELMKYDEYGKHYAETLRRWRKDFYANTESVYKLGFDEQFVRMWNYYLCICEAAFDTSNIYLAQMVFKRPNED